MKHLLYLFIFFIFCLRVTAQDFTNDNLQKFTSLVSMEPGKESTMNIYPKGLDTCIPYKEDIRELGRMIVSKKYRTDDDGIQTYLYLDQLEKVMCQQPGFIKYGENDSLVSLHLQQLFNVHKEILTADLPGYNLSGQSIMFYAVRTTFHDFLYEMLNTYHVDPNISYSHARIKPTTILDFAVEELAERKAEQPVNKLRVKDSETVIKIILKASGKLSKDL